MKCMVQFITHCNERYSYLDSVRLALDGGCRWIQLRMKGATDADVRPVAIEVQRLCRDAGATFIIDDRVELVRQIEADGVHLGLHDMPIAEARRQLGADYIIGGTANTFADVKAHYQASANYIGCGPFRFTTTKERLSPLLGLEGYRNIIDQMHQQHIDLPIIAIGGIEVEDIPALLQVGVTGIALSGVVLRADDPVGKMKQIINTISRCRN